MNYLFIDMLVSLGAVNYFLSLISYVYFKGPTIIRYLGFQVTRLTFWNMHNNLRVLLFLGKKFVWVFKLCGWLSQKKKKKEVMWLANV